MKHWWACRSAFWDEVKNTRRLLNSTQHAFSSCFSFLSQDESEVDFHKYPSTSLPDLVSTCSGPDASPSPGEEKENMEPDVEDVRASSLSLPTQDLVRRFAIAYICLIICRFHLVLPQLPSDQARPDCFLILVVFMIKSLLWEEMFNAFMIIICFFSVSMCSCLALNIQRCLAEVFDKKQTHFHGLSDKNKQDFPDIFQQNRNTCSMLWLKYSCFICLPHLICVPGPHLCSWGFYLLFCQKNIVPLFTKHPLAQHLFVSSQITNY